MPSDTRPQKERYSRQEQAKPQSSSALLKIGGQLSLPRRGSSSSVDTTGSKGNNKSETVTSVRNGVSYRRGSSEEMTNNKNDNMKSNVRSRDSFCSTASISSARRARRRPIDPSKDIMVLMPWDDPMVKVGISENEMIEFALCLDEKIEYDEEEEDEDEDHPPVKVPVGADVATPRVVVNEAVERRLNRGSGFQLSSSGATVQCSRYDTYEADSDDEAFVANLTKRMQAVEAATSSPSQGAISTTAAPTESNKPVSYYDSIKALFTLGGSSSSNGSPNSHNHISPKHIPQGFTADEWRKVSDPHPHHTIAATSSVLPLVLFERMVAILERELEIAKAMEPCVKEVAMLHARCDRSVESARSAADLIRTFLGEENDDDDAEAGDDDKEYLKEYLTAAREHRRVEEEESESIAKLLSPAASLSSSLKAGALKRDVSSGSLSSLASSTTNGKIALPKPVIIKSGPGRRGRPPSAARLAEAAAAEAAIAAALAAAASLKSEAVTTATNNATASAHATAGAPTPLKLPASTSAAVAASTDVNSKASARKSRWNLHSGDHAADTSAGGGQHSEAKASNAQLAKPQKGTPRLFTDSFGRVRPSLEYSTTLFPLYTLDQLREYVSLARASPLLRKIIKEYQQLHTAAKASSVTNSDGDGGKGALKRGSKLKAEFVASSATEASSGGSKFSELYGTGIPEASLTLTKKAEDEVIASVYEFWIKKRSGRRNSLLRCYHNFIMENWHRQQSLPPVPDDIRDRGATLLQAHEKLTRMRYDLDRSRLIIDRVRRREKVKRELIRTAADSLDAFIVARKGVEEESGGSAKNKNKGAKKPPARGKNKGEDSNSDALLPFSLESVDYLADYGLDVNETHNTYNQNNSATISPRYGLYSAASAKASAADDAASQASVPMPGRSRGVSVGSVSSDNSHHSYYPLGPNVVWSADEDRMLLLGVATCGVGRWSDIREEFGMSRSSPQMNQRFTRLTNQRVRQVEGSSKASTIADDNDSEATEGDRAESPEEQAKCRAKLSPAVRYLLENFNEDAVWEAIAIRYLTDDQVQERRSGRPMKHPVRIPIPDYVGKKKISKFADKLMTRPSLTEVPTPAKASATPKEAKKTAVTKSIVVTKAAATAAPAPAASTARTSATSSRASAASASRVIASSAAAAAAISTTSAAKSQSPPTAAAPEKSKKKVSTSPPAPDQPAKTATTSSVAPASTATALPPTKRAYSSSSSVIDAAIAHAPMPALPPRSIATMAFAPSTSTDSSAASSSVRAASAAQSSSSPPAAARGNHGAQKSPPNQSKTSNTTASAVGKTGKSPPGSTTTGSREFSPILDSSASATSKEEKAYPCGPVTVNHASTRVNLAAAVTATMRDIGSSIKSAVTAAAFGTLGGSASSTPTGAAAGGVAGKRPFADVSAVQVKEGPTTRRQKTTADKYDDEDDDWRRREGYRKDSDRDTGDGEDEEDGDFMSVGTAAQSPTASVTSEVVSQSPRARARKSVNNVTAAAAKQREEEEEEEEDGERDEEEYDDGDDDDDEDEDRAVRGGLARGAPKSTAAARASTRSKGNVAASKAVQTPSATGKASRNGITEVSASGNKRNRDASIANTIEPSAPSSSSRTRSLVGQKGVKFAASESASKLQRTQKSTFSSVSLDSPHWFSSDEEDGLGRSTRTTARRKNAATPAQGAQTSAARSASQTAAKSASTKAVAARRNSKQQKSIRSDSEDEEDLEEDEEELDSEAESDKASVDESDGFGNYGDDGDGGNDSDDVEEEDEEEGDDNDEGESESNFKRIGTRAALQGTVHAPPSLYPINKPKTSSPGLSSSQAVTRMQNGVRSVSAAISNTPGVSSRPGASLPATRQGSSTAPSTLTRPTVAAVVKKAPVPRCSLGSLGPPPPSARRNSQNTPTPPQMRTRGFLAHR